MKQRNLWIMSGPPGSGKTTYVKKQIEILKKKNPETQVFHFSRDEIRFSLLEEGEDYFAKEDYVKKIFYNSIVMALLAWDNCDIFVDATFLSPKTRVGFINKVLSVVKKDVNVNIIAFDVSLDICLTQNAYRTGRSYVPIGALERMYYSYKVPTKEEYPYKRILVIKNE